MGSSKRPDVGSVLVFLATLAFGFLYVRSCSAQDLIFENGFGPDDCPGERCGESQPPPFSCTFAPGYPFGYPPDGLQFGGTQTLASLPEVGFDLFTQVKMQGGTWRAYSFTRADMIADVTAWNGDTSNTGGPPGADVRFFNVSECEGDFRALTPGCYGNVGEGPFLYTSFDPLTTGTCPLDPAKTYYWNVHMGPAPCNSSGPNLCAFRFTFR